MKRNNTRSTIAIILCMLYIAIPISMLVTLIVTIDRSPTPIQEQTAPISVSTETESTEPMETEPTESTEPMETEPTEPTIEWVETDTEPTEQTTIATEPQVWWTDYELDMLAAVIYYEAGSDECTDRHQQLVAQVVLNRVASHRYPNTIYNVITQVNPVQYSTYKDVLKNMGTDKIPQRCYDNALVALNGGVDCPPNVIFQANFKQGSGIYEEIYTSYSISYFCYE